MNKLNTDIGSYHIDELFSLLDIQVEQSMTTSVLKNQIEAKCEEYIKHFEELKKPDLVTFFTNVKHQLLGYENDSTISTIQKTLLSYENEYIPFMNTKQVKTGQSNGMFEKNTESGNPIYRKTVSKLLNIDSRFRENYELGTSSDFTIDLPYPIHNVIEMTLCDLELPCSHYPLNQEHENNYLWIKGTDTTRNSYYFFLYIPEGNYYYQKALDYLNNELLDSIVFSMFNFVFDLESNNTANIGNGTGKVSFKKKPNTQHNFETIELNFNAPPITNQFTSKVASSVLDISFYDKKSNIPLEQRFGWMLGFRNPMYTSLLAYTSESILNILGPQYVFLIVDDYNKSNNVNFISASRYGMLPDNIIARISLKGSTFTIQSQNDFSVYAEPRFYYGPVNISKLTIRLVDEHNRTLLMNDSDFSFTLRMTTVYSKT
jgi:hypothetical protein|uniref:Uncharacterized protein n=1 Tax=viral metagenome TaxID=1070528 RepID=A0A6C0HMM4_9ZZZZ